MARNSNSLEGLRPLACLQIKSEETGKENVEMQEAVAPGTRRSEGGGAWTTPPTRASQVCMKVLFANLFTLNQEARGRSCAPVVTPIQRQGL